MEFVIVRDLVRSVDLLSPWSRVLLQQLIVSQLESAYFMEPEGLLLCAQGFATGRYPELEESSSDTQTVSL
jgi:hypothetical protein